jgi:hypothetical protein
MALIADCHGSGRIDTTAALQRNEAMVSILPDTLSSLALSGSRL